MHIDPKITVIVSTYNKPDWLEKVLWGYSCQNFNEFELIIADDGSGPETEALITRYQKNYPVPLRHVWHDAPDYQRQTILNKAIVQAKGDIILFTDGDCIPRADFVETHFDYAQKGRFLSGGYCKLPMKTSLAITRDDVVNQSCFDVNWLGKIEKVSFKNQLKLNAYKFNPNLLDQLTPTKPTFNNCNSSAYKADLLAVNGYDERMKYGGPDREIGERLENFGVKGKQVRYNAICIHLDHERGYATKDSWARNYDIRKAVKKNNLTWTEYGIVKGRNKATR